MLVGSQDLGVLYGRDVGRFTRSGRVVWKTCW